MPYITIEAGSLTTTQKKELIEQLTATAAQIMQTPPEFFITTIKELPEENIGIGGKTIDVVKAEYKKHHNL